MVPTPFHHPSTILPSSFERFYRQCLRRVAGRRLRSSILLATYAAWASSEGEASIGYATLRRYMRAAGHDRTKSDGIHYLDIVLAADVPDLADTFRALPVRDPAQLAAFGAALAAIDAATVQLAIVRRILVGDDE